MHLMSDKPFFIQIGFNKCATSALAKLFLKGGYKALHSGGRIWRLNGVASITEMHPQSRIAENIDAGRPPLAGLEDFDAFFDMLSPDDPWPLREHHKEFERFAEAYPNAKFLLNTRNVEDWLRSRFRHDDGAFGQHAMDQTGLDRHGVEAMWRADYETHHARVRAYFKDTPGRCLEFDIDSDDVTDLIGFAAPAFTLDPAHWGRVRVTDRVARKKGWADRNA